MSIQHSAIPDAQLHEPKGVAAAATGKSYIANGSGSGTWSFDPHIYTLDIANLDTVADYYLVFPYAGTIDKLSSVVDSAIAGADKVLTMSLAGVAITTGALTVPIAGSVAGQLNSVTPTALKTIAAGAALRIAATGASTGAARCHLSITFVRTA